MKKLITILSLSLSLTSFAGVITCSNNPNSPGQYTSLQDAIDNANAGDTILVHGSGTSYGNITLNSKALTFIGAGINQPSSDISQLGRVQIYRLSASVSGSGCTFIGLNICLFDMNPTFTGGGIKVHK